MAVVSEVAEANKKQRELEDFNYAMAQIVGEVVLCIMREEECYEEDMAEEYAREEAAEEEYEREHEQEKAYAQQYVQQQGEFDQAPEAVFFMGVYAANLEPLMGVFRNFKKQYDHMDYAAHEFSCALSDEGDQATFRFPNSHIARSYLDFMARFFPGIQLFALPGRRRVHDENDEDIYFSPTPFNTDLTRR